MLSCYILHPVLKFSLTDESQQELIQGLDRSQ